MALEINTSGEYNEYMNGELINNSEYVANYDGDVLDFAFKNNDEEFYSQLNNEELLDLLNSNQYPRDRENIFTQLTNEFPLKNENSNTRTRSKTKKSKKKNKKTSKSKRLTARQKLGLINSVFD
tara:strand:- start:260 stop:631 length:372 start_codon:yes stop_codon:yes gene_type:complete